MDGSIEAVSAVGTALDIGDIPAIRNWVEAAAKRFGRIDAVVANVKSDSCSDFWR